MNRLLARILLGTAVMVLAACDPQSVKELLGAVKGAQGAGTPVPGPTNAPQTPGGPACSANGLGFTGFPGTVDIGTIQGRLLGNWTVWSPSKDGKQIAPVMDALFQTTQGAVGVYNVQFNAPGSGEAAGTGTVQFGLDHDQVRLHLTGQLKPGFGPQKVEILATYTTGVSGVLENFSGSSWTLNPNGNFECGQLSLYRQGVVPGAATASPSPSPVASPSGVPTPEPSAVPGTPDPSPTPMISPSPTAQPSPPAGNQLVIPPTHLQIWRLSNNSGFYGVEASFTSDDPAVTLPTVVTGYPAGDWTTPELHPTSLPLVIHVKVSGYDWNTITVDKDGQGNYTWSFAMAPAPANPDLPVRLFVDPSAPAFTVPPAHLQIWRLSNNTGFYGVEVTFTSDDPAVSLANVVTGYPAGDWTTPELHPTSLPLVIHAKVSGYDWNTITVDKDGQGNYTWSFAMAPAPANPDLPIRLFE